MLFDREIALRFLVSAAFLFLCGFAALSAPLPSFQ